MIVGPHAGVGVTCHAQAHHRLTDGLLRVDVGGDHSAYQLHVPAGVPEQVPANARHVHGLGQG